MNSSSISFSILIPAYKAKYLNECLDSCLAQTYDNFEIIVVNDASPENLDAVMKPYEGEGRIKYYKNEKNCGAENVVDNWNKCLNYASGMFVICMGDDDFLGKDALMEYAEAIQKYPQVKVFHARTIIVDANGGREYIENDRSEYESIYSFMRHRLEGCRQFIGDFCFERVSLLARGGFYKLPLAWGSDDISVFLAGEKDGVVNIKKPTFYYRNSPLTISSSGNVLLKLSTLDKYEDFCRTLLDRLQPLTEEDRETAKIDKKILHKSVEKMKLWVIFPEIKMKKIRFIKWLLAGKKYNVSRRVVLQGLMKSMREAL